MHFCLVSQLKWICLGKLNIILKGNSHRIHPSGNICASLANLPLCRFSVKSWFRCVISEASGQWIFLHKNKRWILLTYLSLKENLSINFWIWYWPFFLTPVLSSLFFPSSLFWLKKCREEVTISFWTAVAITISNCCAYSFRRRISLSISECIFLPLFF